MLVNSSFLLTYHSIFHLQLLPWELHGNALAILEFLLIPSLLFLPHLSSSSSSPPFCIISCPLSLLIMTFHVHTVSHHQRVIHTAALVQSNRKSSHEPFPVLAHMTAQIHTSSTRRSHCHGINLELSLTRNVPEQPSIVSSMHVIATYPDVPHISSGALTSIPSA